MRKSTVVAVTIIAGLAQLGCSEMATVPVSAGTGPNPVLPRPVKNLIPTINAAPAVGWTAASKPKGLEGTKVSAFAENLDHPRWIYVLPNGDVLVAETNAPKRTEDFGGLKGFFANLVMKKAGAKTVSADRITLLRDTDGDGVADFQTVFLSGLRSPFGMTLVDNTLYVANTDAIVKVPYKTGETLITMPIELVIALPAGTINHHWTKNIIASVDGKKLFVSVGSNSNVAERGMENEIDRAAIWEVDLATGQKTIFADGLRNPVGMAWDESSATLFTVVNERDELGSDLVPDYLTAVKKGAFYGWPYSYFGKNIDERVSPGNLTKVASAIVPDYALGAHTASLGLASSKGSTLSSALTNGMFVGQHGSWNRKPHSGYKVIFVPFLAGKPSGVPIDILTEFLTPNGQAQGRPAGVAIDKRGNLLVADDVGNKIWQVSAVK